MIIDAKGAIGYGHMVMLNSKGSRLDGLGGGIVRQHSNFEDNWMYYDYRSHR